MNLTRIWEIHILLNCCFPPVNMSFITVETQLKKKKKKEGKLFFPPYSLATTMGPTEAPHFSGADRWDSGKLVETGQG